jgi:N-acetylglucosamine kinase
MKVFLGVDGGQSSTTALVGDAGGRVIGYGRAGPCNHVSGDERREKFLRVVGGCVEEACRQAGIARTRFTSACLGFSGGAEDKRELVEQLLQSDQTEVTHDALIALTGATAGRPGIITIAGTGSIAFGRNAAGKTARSGGWGYVFGDEGGGFDLTRQALRAALRMEEGWGPATVLRNKLLQAGGASSANELLHQFYKPDYPKAKIAAFSKLVEQAAWEGDAVAAAILKASAQQLAMLASAVRGQLFAGGEPARVAWIGGVFGCALVLETFRMLVELEEGNQCSEPVMGPAAGALLEAYRLAGLSVELTGLPEAEK